MKEFTSLGLMSGTSGDGVDASIIISDGNSKYEVIKDKNIMNMITKFITTFMISNRKLIAKKILNFRLNI